MSSPSTNVVIKDVKEIFQGRTGVTPAFVVRAGKGSIEPALTDYRNFVGEYGDNRTDLGSDVLKVRELLKSVKSAYVVRAVPNDITSGCLLIRADKGALPNTFSSDTLKDYEVKKSVEPLDVGLTQEAISAYSFPQTIGDREYSKISAKFLEAYSQAKTLQVNTLTDFKVGSKYSAVTSGSIPNNNSVLFEVADAYSKNIDYDRVTLATSITANKDDTIQLQNVGAFEAYNPKISIVGGTQDLSNSDYKKTLPLNSLNGIVVGETIRLMITGKSLNSLKSYEIVSKNTTAKTAYGLKTLGKYALSFIEADKNTSVELLSITSNASEYSGTAVKVSQVSNIGTKIVTLNVITNVTEGDIIEITTSGTAYRYCVVAKSGANKTITLDRGLEVATAINDSVKTFAIASTTSLGASRGITDQNLSTASADSQVFLSVDASITDTADARSVIRSKHIGSGNNTVYNGFISLNDNFGKSFNVSYFEVVLNAEYFGTASTAEGSVGSGVELHHKPITYVNITGSPKLVKSVDNSVEIFVSDNDNLLVGQILKIGSAIVEVRDKDVYTLTEYFIDTDVAVTNVKTDDIYLLTKSKYSNEYALLVYGVNAGAWNKNISVAIDTSTSYPDKAFFIKVYHKGVLQESFEVSRQKIKDGFGRDFYVENRINGVSKYIKVKDNILLDSTVVPKSSMNAVWRRNAYDIFNKTNAKQAKTDEIVNKDDTVIKVDDTNNGLSTGDRVKFLGYADEYTITSTTGSGANKSITLSRGVIIPANVSLVKGTALLKFDNTNDSTDENDNTTYVASDGSTKNIDYIKDGKRWYLAEELAKVIYPLYYINQALNMEGVNNSQIEGKILDAGANRIKEASDGSAITSANMIEAFNKMNDRLQYPFTLIGDLGYTVPTFINALKTFAIKYKNQVHLYTSSSSQSEGQSNKVSAVDDYYNSLNLDSEAISFAVGWQKLYDEDTDSIVAVSPDIFFIMRQSNVGEIFGNPNLIASGTQRGGVNSLGSKYPLTDTELDYFAEKNYNAIKEEKGAGVYLWGNRTTRKSPGVLQFRSVVLYLVSLIKPLKDITDNSIFDYVDPSVINILRSAITNLLIKGVNNKIVKEFSIDIPDMAGNTQEINIKMSVRVGKEYFNISINVGTDIAVVEGG